MESIITLESFTTNHIMKLMIREFCHLLSKEDQCDISKDPYITVSQIYRRAYETKDPLYFHLNLIYEGLIGIDNANLLRKYGIATLQEDFPKDDTQTVYLHNFFINCYICAITVSMMNIGKDNDISTNESTISTLFIRLVNEEKDRIGITEVVNNVYSLCELIWSGIEVNNASLFIVPLFNPLNASFFQESLLRDCDEKGMTNGAKEFLKYLMPPKDFEQLEDLIVNVSCFFDFCQMEFRNGDEVMKYLNDNSALDDFQIKIICIHMVKEMIDNQKDSNKQNDMIQFMTTISKEINIKQDEEDEDQKEFLTDNITDDNISNDDI